MAGNFTYSYVFQKNIAYAVSRANFLTYLTAMGKAKHGVYAVAVVMVAMARTCTCNCQLRCGSAFLDV